MKTNRSVERAISILMFVCQNDRPLGLTAISRGVELDKATTLRLLSTLANADLVRQDENSRSYVAGAGIYNFWPSEIRKICRAHLKILLDGTMETICLIVPQGRQRVCIDVFEPDRELRIVARTGRTLPIYVGAAGRVFMAHKPVEQVERILSECELQAFTLKSVTDREIYCRQLDEVRSTGYAFNADEVELGTSAIAAPVFDGLGNTAAAIAVRGPDSRMNETVVEEIIPLIKATARAISNELASIQN